MRPAFAKVAQRRCEQCNGTLPNRMSRTRNDKGQLVCEECAKMTTPKWASHSSLTPEQQAEFQKRAAEALRSITRVAAGEPMLPWSDQVASDYSLGDRVKTEFGEGSIAESTGRSILVTLDSGEQIRVQRGTPGFDRVQRLSATSARRCEEFGCTNAVAWVVNSKTLGDWKRLLCDEHKDKYAEIGTAPRRTSSRKVAHDSGDNALIHHCPFCLSGNTRYLTKDGVKTFEETAGTTQWVLTAEENQRTSGRWVQAHIHEFGEQPLLRITLRRNKRIKVVEATAEHRWLVKSNKRRVVDRVGHRSRKGLPRDHRFPDCANGHPFTEEDTRVRADGSRDCKRCAQQAQPYLGTSRATDVDVLTQDLKPGMRLSSLRQEGVAADLRPDEAGIRHGVVFGDGSANGKYATVTLWGEKDKQLLRYFPGRRYKDDNTATRVLGTGIPGVKVSGNLWAWMKAVPSLDESPEYLYGWLAGYFAADGTVSKQGQVQISSANLGHLEAVRDIALRLGITTYEIRSQMRVGFPGREPSPLYTVDFLTSTINEDFFLIEEHRDRYRFRNYGHERLGWTVVSVEETGKVETVYCAVVPETHSFALDGNIWTGNCGSGAVTGGSDGTADCDYCHSVFTVQVQPKHPHMPQTINGQPMPPPGMPAGSETELSIPVDPAVDEDASGAAVEGFGQAEATEDERVPPQFRQSMKTTEHLSAQNALYFTDEGDVLDAERYMARLALLNADDRMAVLAKVRRSHDD